MNRETERQLLQLIDRIRGYKKGFEFTINFSQIPTKAQENGMKWVLKKAEDEGLIEIKTIGLSLEDIQGKSGRFCTEETYVRI